MEVLICKNQKDLKTLAAIMQKSAIDSPDFIEDYQCSDTTEIAEERVKEIQSNEQWANDLANKTKLIAYPDKTGDLINLCLSLKCPKDKPKEWNFSVSRIVPSGETLSDRLQRVNDDMAKMLAEIILGEGYEEVEPKAIFQTIRHFVKNVQEP